MSCDLAQIGDILAGMGNAYDVDAFQAALRMEVRLEMARQGGMKPSELSRRSGVSTSQMSRLLSDDPEPGRKGHWTIEYIMGIGAALGLAPIELLERAQRRYNGEAD